jgi:hypothetical protein
MIISDEKTVPIMKEKDQILQIFFEDFQAVIASPSSDTL